jgi:four helix bundle protein
VADFKKLRVWQAAQELAVQAHRVTSRMRGTRSAALSDQLTRAAMSVPTNIVEGSAHESPLEFSRFVRYALASVTEVEGHVRLAADLGMMTEQDFEALLAQVEDVRKMLYGLLKKLNATGNASRERQTENGKSGNR